MRRTDHPRHQPTQTGRSLHTTTAQTRCGRDEANGPSTPRSLGIARALLNSPTVLLLADPTVWLDPRQRAGLRDVIVDLARRQTVLVSTHLPKDVAAVADHVAVLDQGRVVFDGDLAEIIWDLPRGRLLTPKRTDHPRHLPTQTGRSLHTATAQTPCGTDEANGPFTPPTGANGPFAPHHTTRTHGCRTMRSRTGPHSPRGPEQAQPFSASVQRIRLPRRQTAWVRGTPGR